jgi:hypothetical protein
MAAAARAAGKGVSVRIVLASLLLALAGTTSAQILRSPVYYLVTAPEVEVGGSVDGSLDATSGQNFKDGSRVSVTVLRPEPGEPLVIDVHSDAFDAYLSVFGPDGSLLEQVDDGPEGLDPRTVFTPAAEGAHLLVVSGYGPHDVGPFTISVAPAEVEDAQPLPLPGRVDAELRGSEPSDPEIGYGSTRSFVMEVEERSLVRIRAESDDIDTVLAVFDRYGWLDQNDDAGGSTDSELLLELSPGRYRVAVAAWGGGTGTFTLRTELYLPVD